MTTNFCMGIDFGTSNSAVGIYRDNSVFENPQMIDFNSSKRFFPSIVSIKKDDIVVGSEKTSDYNDFYNIKRFMGQKNKEGYINEFIKTLTYNVSFDDENLPVINEKYLEDVPDVGKCYKKGRAFKPEQIVAFIFGFIKEKVKERIKDINECVVCVPANFNQRQRNSIKISAEICGLKVIGMITEPVAACITLAYADLDTKSTHYVIVYDFGAGTLDVALVKISKGKFTILATDGDPNCGGVDVDNAIYNYVIQELKRKYKKNPKIEKIIDEISGRNKRLLIDECEKAKICLSTSLSYDIVVSNILRIEKCIISVNRSVIDDYFSKPSVNKKIVDPLRSVLKKIPKDKKIDKVVFVGGSSNIEIVKTIVQKEIDKVINKDSSVIKSTINVFECVAKGAAIYGASLKGIEIEQLPKIVIEEITPMSIKIATKKSRILAIEKNTKIPTKSEKIVFQFNKKEALFHIIEGDYKEDREKDRNHNIGDAVVKLPKSGATCKAVVSVEKNMSISVEYKIDHGEWKSIKIIQNIEKDIDEMKKIYQEIIAKRDEKSCKNIFYSEFKKNVKNIKSKVSLTKKKREIENIWKECQREYRNNEKAFTKEVFGRKLKILEDKAKESIIGYKRNEKLDDFITKNGIK